MNLETLAKLAEVSVGTVSKAFSGSKEISEDTKDRIFALAKEHGCFDKYNKNRFEKKVVAVLCPEIKSEYYTTIATLLERQITSHGGIMLLSTTEFSEEREMTLFSYYASYCKADGIITINQSAAIDNTFHVPAVAILPTGNAVKSKNIDCIVSDKPNAIEQAIAYLKGLGHTQIGFVGEYLTMAKLDSFKTALRKCGLSVEERFVGISENALKKPERISWTRGLPPETYRTLCLRLTIISPSGLSKACSVPENVCRTIARSSAWMIFPWCRIWMCR